MDNPQNSPKEHLLALARSAQQNAYARYSNFKVGAAILLENGEIFTGCNVENASYGLTNCAERSAIFSAVSKVGGANVRIRAVAVVNDHDAPCSPCGACRQVIAEFGPDAVVWYQGPQGIQESTMRQLLPECFVL
jgi:cytidine deaminase